METKKDTIIKEAIEEFATKSFEASSLNTIIKNSGTSKGTFYHHFKDKSSLYIFIIKTLVEDQKKYIRDSESLDVVDLDEDIFAIFEKQASKRIEFYKQNPKYHAISKNLRAEVGNPIYKAVVQELELEEDLYLKTLIQKAYATQKLNTYYPVEFITATISHLFMSFNEIYTHQDTDATYNEHLQNLMHFMRYGFATPTHKKERGLMHEHN